MQRKEINSRITQATKWSSITEIACKLIAPITNMVLARLLTPEAFGVVATLTMVVSFAEIFTDAGFQKYLVQHQFVDEDDLDRSTNVAFWANLLFSVVLWGVIACFADPLATLVGSPGCGSAIMVMSAQIPLLAFSSIQTARFRRDFNFKSLFVARMATALVPIIITVPLAIFFRSYWALVFGTLARDILNAIILTAKSRWKPRLEFSIRRLKKMLSFSLWTVVENISIWLTSYIGTFIVGAALSDHYLGLYKTTMSTVNGYMGIITSITIPVLFSALSRCQDDEKAFQEVFFRFQRITSLFLLPLGFGIFIYRELAVSILLGNQWGEVADFFGWWSLTSALTIVLSYYDSEVFRSKGKPKLSVASQLLHLICVVPVLLWAMNKGFAILTISRSLVRLQGVVVSACIMHFIMKIRFGKVMRNVWPSLVAATVMAIAGAGLRAIWDNMIWECVSIALCVCIYTGALMMIPAGRKQLAEIPVLQKLLHLPAPPEQISQ